MVNIKKHNKQIENCNLYVITAIIGNKRQKEKRKQRRGKNEHELDVLRQIRVDL